MSQLFGQYNIRDMHQLTFAEISGIRRALQGMLGRLEWMLERGDQPDSPHVRRELETEIQYYRELLNTFETVERASIESRQVIPIYVPEGREDDPG